MPEDIENPVINAPYDAPTRHFRFGEQGITNSIAEGRRSSTFFVPIAAPRRTERQLHLEGVLTADRMRENDLINRIRVEVELWRRGGYRGITAVSRRLLEHWSAEDRYRRLFFCQIEAAETAIFIAEAAPRLGVPWIGNELRRLNAEHNGEIYRLAIKIATGGGKTLVMGMLIAWQTLNKAADLRDKRFSDRFLVVTPGITVRDRLRVLKPSDPDNVYDGMDLVPLDIRDVLNGGIVEITNYHAFLRREKVDAARLTKKILAPGGGPAAFSETADEMVNRVCRAFGSRKTGIVVINDEAHHCYYRKRDPEAEGELTVDERKEIDRESKTAEVWISGLEAIRSKVGLKAVYDLSATPFFLKGSGYVEGTLFPWVISDFALIDAIEAGIVKIPRVPVADNRATGDPAFRSLWANIRSHLPKGTRSLADASGEPRLPADLESALGTLYEDYERSCEQWEGIETPPVFIVVCNNTRVSKMVFDYLAGWEKILPEGSAALVPGRLALFSNVANGRWKDRPSTLLVDSVELEAGEMSSDFRAAAAHEIEEFKADYRTRSAGKDPNQMTDEELLREVLNTVGKAGKLGADVRCVVSVSMLAEGWDATTVTHILGVRAFGTQLLCEQVVGRALRRHSYVPNPETGYFDPEYAEVYGVPFAFIPTAASRSIAQKMAVSPNHVATVPTKTAFEIWYPRVTGYRYDAPLQRLTAEFDESSRMRLTTEDVVTEVICDPIVGMSDVHTYDSLRKVRSQAVAFGLARRVLENYFRDEDNHPMVWLFPQLVQVCKRWLDECLVCSSATYPQLLLLAEPSLRAAGRIYLGIVAAEGHASTVKPILDASQPMGSTNHVEFDTLKPVVDITKSHLNRMAIDSNWEQKVGYDLDRMPEVAAWVKNDRLGPDRKGLRIPYIDQGRQVEYIPDFIARIDGGGGADWHLLIEVTGERRDAKLAKAGTAINLWLPAVNNWGQHGYWDYIEVHDPWMAMEEVLRKIASVRSTSEVAVNG